MLSRRLTRSPRYGLAAGFTGLCVALCAFAWDAKAQSEGLVQECNQLATAVNQNAEIMADFEAEIDNFAQNASQAETLDDVKSAAKQYVDAVDNVTTSLDELVVTLDALALSDDQLSLYRDEYATVVTGFNEALTSVATAMTGVAETETETQLPERIETLESETGLAVRQIDQLAVQESDIVEEVNTHCGVNG